MTEREVQNFLAQFDQAREDFKTWPKWMQDAAVERVASLPMPPKDGVLGHFQHRGETRMKMDRNLNDDGTGKYLVVNLRKLDAQAGHAGTFERWSAGVQQALDTLESLGVLEWGAPGSEDEFFLLKLKDRHAGAALTAYADSIEGTDPEFALEVRELATRAGPANRFCKEPD